MGFKKNINNIKNKLNYINSFYSINHDYEFSKIQMWLFIGLAMLVPIIVSFVLSICSIYFNLISKSDYVNIVFYVKLGSIGLSSIIFMVGNIRDFFFKRQYIYYMQYPLINLIGSILSAVIGLIFYELFKNNDKNLVNNVFQLCIAFYQIMIILLFSIKNKIFIDWFKKAFNSKKSILVTVSLIGIGFLVFYLLQLGFSFLPKLIDKNAGGNSNNQESLNKMTITTLGTISLFISAVIVAPILEEILYRYFISYFCNGGIWGYLFSTLFFAALHVMNKGDYVQIFPYFALGIVNGFIYYKFKNLTPCIAIHFIGNFASFIFILMQK